MTTATATQQRPAGRPGPVSPAPAGTPGWGPLLVVLAGTFMALLDFFIVNVALPSIQSGLHASRAAVQLIIAGYGLTFATGMISGGRLGDLYGRRRMFMTGLALFTLTSAACGLAPGAGLLIGARVLQGAAGALMTPQVLAIIGIVYAGSRRDRAFAAYGLAMGFAGVLGQLLGGAIITASVGGSGWRGIFLINVPVGLIALVLARRVIPEFGGSGVSGSTGRLDPAGTALATAGLAAVVAPLIEGQQYGWPAWTWASLAAAPVLLGGFVVHQRRRAASGRSPLVDPGLFASRGFSVGSLAALAFGLVPASFFFVLALFLQDGLGLSPLLSGEVFAAVGAGYFAAMMLATGLARRLGRQVLALGAAVVAAGALLLAAADGGTSWAPLLPGLAVTGFGIGLVLVPLSATVLAGVDPQHAGAAAGVLATAQQVGGAVGVALVGVVFYRSLGAGAFGHAMTVALILLAGLTVATAALVQLLPRRAR
ncbi:MAG TPA: MFS transporter [Streptosporangiaceae bacterium]|nr:MFS transporter [Streptosporangiaceae bacterium]